MSRTSVRRHQRKKTTASRPKPVPPISDRAVYMGIGIVGFFFVILVWLVTADSPNDYWRWALLGYLALAAYMINICAFRIYRGHHISDWKQSLARIPLRFIGYGTKTGKPLEAAHHHPEIRKALIVSVAICLVLLAGATVLMIPGLLW